MRRVAIVSPYFPPSTLAGVHRARLLARWLPEAGWEPVVFCVDERFHEEPLDPALAALVPPAARVVRTGAVPARFARRVGVGDLSLRGWRPLRRAVDELLAREKIDVVMITMGPFYTGLLARPLKERHRVPIVLDYQDPWVSRWGATLPMGTKGGISHALAVLLEPRALRWADAITAVSDGTWREILERHPALGEERCATIPIGGDAEDFDHAVDAGRLPKEAGLVYVRYVGTLLPRAGDTLRAIFRAVAALRRSGTELGARLRLDFVGSSNQPGGSRDHRVLPIAREEGVADAVREIPERVPYLQALALLQSADVVLAFGSDERHYTASKIYPALLSGRPLLAAFHEASSVCDVVGGAGSVCLVKYGDARPALSCVREIGDAIVKVASCRGADAARRREALAPYLGPAVARSFAGVFERAAAEGPRGANW